jgi:hypothetical protein
VNYTATPSPKSSLTTNNTPTLWADNFEQADWKLRWNLKKSGSWGLDSNASVVSEPDSPFPTFLRVRFPRGSASPAATRKEGARIGGGQFYSTEGIQPRDSLRLSYYVRFAKNFDFVKGGKLPGLFGGRMTSGGRIPNGTNGFSTRFMWRRGGAGEAYLYLPTSTDYGTSYGRGNWFFQPGVWHHLEQRVVLNEPGTANGSIQVWLDGKSVLTQPNLTFRTINSLKIEGIFFSTFFGGDDTSWASSQDTYIDFANFSLAAE